MGVSDQEWTAFYREFIIPFNACVPGPNQTIPEASFLACLAEPVKSKLPSF